MELTLLSKPALAFAPPIRWCLCALLGDVYFIWRLAKTVTTRTYEKDLSHAKVFGRIAVFGVDILWS